MKAVARESVCLTSASFEALRDAGRFGPANRPSVPSSPLAEAPSIAVTGGTVAVTTAPAPALTPPPQYILHKNVQYPARDVKLPNGPDALVPIGFERWRVTPGGLRWPLRLNTVTGDVK